MIEKITIKNWKCHSDLSLDFKKGVNFIIGVNGIGKTSILEAIIYGLMGRVRTKDKRMFKKIDSTGETSVALRFEHDKKEYEIIRTLNGKSRLKKPSKSEISTPKVIMDYIEKLFDSNKVFLENILYSSEGETYSFLKLNQKDLVNYLESLIGIGKINEFNNLIKKLNKEFDNRRKKYQNYIKTLKGIVKSDDLGDKEKLEKERTKLHEKLYSLNTQIIDIRRQISKLKNEKEEVLGKNFDFRRVTSEIKMFYQDKQIFFLELGLEEFNIPELLSRIEDINQIYKELLVELENKKKEVDMIEKKLIRNKLKLEERREIQVIIDKLKHNYEEDINVICPLCKKALSKEDFIQVHKDTFTEIDNFKNRMSKLQGQSKKEGIELRQLKLKLNSLEKIMKLLERWANFDESQIQHIEGILTKLDEQVKQEEKKIEEIRAKRRKLENELSKIKDALYEIRAAEKVKDKLKYEKNLGASIKGGLICDIAEEALNEILKKQRDINLDDLINEIEKIWKVFFPYDDRNLFFDNKYIPYFKKSGEIVPYKNASAGERMILLILIKTLLLKKYTKIPFLILDEPLEHLNLENRINIIDYLIDIHRKGLIKQLIITTFEESLTRKYINSDIVNIISLPSIKKYQTQHSNP